MPTSEAFDKLYEVFKTHRLSTELELETLREEYNNLAVSFPPIDGTTFKEVDAAGVRAEWVDVSESKPTAVVMYLHGGGYVMGTIEMYRDMTTRLAKVGKVKVLSVDYRLAPENKFPAALEDSIKVYKWLLSQEYKPQNIIIAGDSAGGGLTLATLLKIRSLGLKMPAAAVCISPWTDLALIGKSIEAKAEVDPILDYNLLKYFADCYVGEDGDRCKPFVSPFYADLSGLPPILMMVGEREVLLDDAIIFSQKVEYYGVKTTMVVAQGMTHIWPFFAPVIPEGQQAINYIGKFISKRI
ncbi:MAG: alpha/beta hydrolase [Selenomonadaceae bacterium]|nr:alpha/beta hydrolase [Selenomonadaceae bacterium]